jgi:UDP-N-acetylglucosamine pyrophosphorylase
LFSIAKQENDTSVALDKLVENAKGEKEIFRAEMEGFKQLVAKFSASKGKDTIDWDKIKSPPEDMVVKRSALPEVKEEGVKHLGHKLVVLKLNGGLGTTMGCTGPKSVIEVRSESTFLDLTVEQVKELNAKHGCTTPLVLMNSFNTHDDTLNVVNKYKGMEHFESKTSIKADILVSSGSPSFLSLKTTLVTKSTGTHQDMEMCIEHFTTLDYSRK